MPALSTIQVSHIIFHSGSLSVFLEGNIPLGSASVTIDVAVPDPTGYFGNLLAYYVKQQLGAQMIFTRGPCANGAPHSACSSNQLVCCESVHPIRLLSVLYDAMDLTRFVPSLS
jgi:hypothetical protein